MVILIAADLTRLGGPLPRPTIKHSREAGPGNWYHYIEVVNIYCTFGPCNVHLQWGKWDGEWLAEDIFSLDGVEEISESRCNTRKVVIFFLIKEYICTITVHRKKTRENATIRVGCSPHVSILISEICYIALHCIALDKLDPYNPV